MRACEMNHIEIVIMLIHLGANMDIQNEVLSFLWNYYSQ